MRSCEESFFESFDSTKLFFRTWRPNSPQSKKALIVLHRGHEHSGRLQDIVDGLNLPDYWAFAYDARGHGKSPGPRGYAEDFSYLTKDLDTFVRMISEKHKIPLEDMAIVANSVGAVVATTWIHDYAPRVRCMVLAAPAFRVKLYVPFALAGLRLLNLLKKPAFISSYVKSKMLTHDSQEAEKYNQDPLITRDIAVNILIGLFDASTRVLENASSITTPTYILSAGRDFVVKVSAQKKFFNRLGTEKKEFKLFPRFFHGVFYEKGKEEGLLLARKFILECMNQAVDRSYLLRSHLQGPTFEVYKQLQKPANPVKALFFGFQKVFMGTLGRLSHGVNIGWKTGFDSGLSLDYVYENKPRGITPVGKAIDFFYLNAIGWKGIRLRKIHLERQIEKAIEKLKTKNEPIRILDVAGGPGRYLIDLAIRHKNLDLQIVVRDNTEGNLAHGRRMAAEKGLTNIKYEKVDAFSDASSSPFRPNIVVVSGFFELFPNNDLVQKCIQKIVKESSPDAQVIYTGQPYHPQLEMIARSLRNREGQAWVMRLRSQAELDEIFRTHGLEKKEMEIDPFGIFTVSRAENMK